MSEEQFDAAISFLSADLAIARALSAELSLNLRVFMYERSQEVVAGTDGLESFRAIFLKRTRLNVVLYRDGYGETPWTRVELAAIQEKALRDGWNSLVVVSLEVSQGPPVWYPFSRISSSLADYGISGVAAVILARAREAGALGRRESPAELSARLERAALDEESRRQFERSHAGVVSVTAEYRGVFDRIQQECQKIAAQNPMAPPRWGRKPDQIVINVGGVGLSLYWDPHYSNTVENSALVALFFDGILALPDQTGRPARQPREVAQRVFLPALAPDEHWLWTDRDNKKELSSPEMSDILLSDLIQRSYRPGA